MGVTPKILTTYVEIPFTCGWQIAKKGTNGIQHFIETRQAKRFNGSFYHEQQLSVFHQTHYLLIKRKNRLFLVSFLPHFEIHTR